MKKVILHGELALKYGAEFSLDVSTPAEGVRALSLQLPGFLEDLKAGAYHLVRGTKMALDSADQLHLKFGKTKEFHLIPVIAGSKRGGIGKVILGIAIAAAAFWAAPAVVGAAGPTLGMGTEIAFGMTYGNVALFGASMALSGIGQMLSPVPKVGGYTGRERPEERPSFIFNGPINTTEQGQPVPIPYGDVYTGSVVISGSLTTEQLDVNA